SGLHLEHGRGARVRGSARAGRRLGADKLDDPQAEPVPFRDHFAARDQLAVDLHLARLVDPPVGHDHALIADRQPCAQAHVGAAELDRQANVDVLDKAEAGTGKTHWKSFREGGVSVIWRAMRSSSSPTVPRATTVLPTRSGTARETGIGSVCPGASVASRLSGTRTSDSTASSVSVMSPNGASSAPARRVGTRLRTSEEGSSAASSPAPAARRAISGAAPGSAISISSTASVSLLRKGDSAACEPSRSVARNGSDGAISRVRTSATTCSTRWANRSADSGSAAGTRPPRSPVPPNALSSWASSA